LHSPCGGAPQQRGPLTPQTQTRPNRLHTHTHPPKPLAHPRPPIPPLSALTSRATHAHPTSPRSTGFCAIWGCISSSSSSSKRSKTRGRDHNAGPSQPRRRCSLLPTTKPAPRPPNPLAVTVRGRVLRGCAAAPPCTELRANVIAMHSSGSGDRDATEAQDKATWQIMEWLSEKRGSLNKQ